MRGLRWRIMLLVIFVGFLSYSQTPKEMTYIEFVDIVRKHHPVMVQADAYVDAAEGGLTESRGVFDPTLKGEMQQKEYDDTKYFQLAEAGLVVPTWIGANVKVGYTQSIGEYVNAMDQMPANGLLIAGVELPIGQGLFFDKRRASVQKAKVYLEMAEAERQLTINNIIYKASVDYWKWFQAHHQLQSVEVLMLKSKDRLDNVKRSAELGDKPFIDTLEAAIQYQNFYSLYLDLSTLEKNTREFVNVHLWADGLVPLELDSTTVPETLAETTLDLSVWSITNDTLIMNHPKLAMAQSKLDLNGVELRMTREQLKPKLNVNYNVLNEPVGGDVIGFNPNDYKFGIDFSIPIFLRSSRGSVQKQKAEMLIAESEMQLTEQNLKAAFKATVNDSKNAVEQSVLLGEVVENYRKLVTAERKLFQIGESSLMLLNYREIALMESEIKWIDKVSKSKIAEIDILYAIGQLN